MSRSIEALGVEIAGSASAFPLDVGIGHELSNEDAYRELLGPDWSNELTRRGWSSTHPADAWGVQTRQWLGAPGRPETAQGDAADLALGAAGSALDDAGVEPGDIELIVATSTPARLSSTIASRLACDLGIEAGALDQRAGGVGGLAAIASACTYLNAGLANALVVASEALSPVLDPSDLGNALIFGDGAAALVLRTCDAPDRGLVLGRFGNASIDGRAFTVPGQLPPTWGDLQAGSFVFQSPDAAYREGVNELRLSVATELGAEARARGVAIDVAVPYAPTAGHARSQAEALGVPLERVLSLRERHGCLGAADGLAAIDEARRTSRLVPGQGLAATAVAGGVAWGSLLWRS